MKIEEDDEMDLGIKRKAKVSVNEPRKGKVNLLGGVKKDVINSSSTIHD